MKPIRKVIYEAFSEERFFEGPPYDFLERPLYNSLIVSLFWNSLRRLR